MTDLELLEVWLKMTGACLRDLGAGRFAITAYDSLLDEGVYVERTFNAESIADAKRQLSASILNQHLTNPRFHASLADGRVGGVPGSRKPPSSTATTDPCLGFDPTKRR